MFHLQTRKSSGITLAVVALVLAIVTVFAIAKHEANEQRRVTSEETPDSSQRLTVPKSSDKNSGGFIADKPQVIEAAPAPAGDTNEGTESSATSTHDSERAAESPPSSTSGDSSEEESSPKASANGSGSEDSGNSREGSDERNSSDSGDASSNGNADCAVPAGVSADKVVVVSGSGGASASVKACEKVSEGYATVFSTSGKVGYSGIAAPGAKREGDGKTPSGVFSLTSGFGVNAKPSAFSGAYTRVSQDHVWVDGNAKKGYNTLKRKSDGYKGESMYQTPAYNYGQVVNYNPKNTPGKGSGIFLHVNTGSGKTAGFVSVSQSQLLKIFAWEGSSHTQIAISR